jgi:pSer/pThr/pTyr-binding forkhead associated (FHA) protein
LLGEANVERRQYTLSKPVITFGKGKFVNVLVKGFLVSRIQAKIIKDKDDFVLVNVGRKGRTKVNGESVQRCRLKNDDLIEVGRSVFRFVQGSDK